MRVSPVLAALLCALAGAAQAVPADWPEPVYGFEHNPRSEAGFELGRALFYDPALSRDGSTSCASCHQQASAFAHTQHRLSHGVGDQLGTRNAPALFNLVWQPQFMWDGAVAHLEMQPLAPITNPVEMDQKLPALLDRLRAHPAYLAQFERAFGSPGIDTQRLTWALAQFTGALVSADSAYDRARRGDAVLPAPAEKGLSVFRQHCASCHREPLFSDFSYRNNGIDAQPADRGRAAISGDAKDLGRFRVPALRNIALTAPYMHDGRFATLDEVIAHYASGIRHSDTLDPQLANGITLSGKDRAALLAFLNTLTDEGFVRNPRFAEPMAAAAASVDHEGWHTLRSALARLLPVRAQAGEPRPRSAKSRIVAVGSRMALSLPPVEVVAVQAAGALLIYVDDYFSNQPLAKLDLSVMSGTRVLRAAPSDSGVYRIELDGGLDEASMSVLIRNAQLDLRLDGVWPEAPHDPVPPRANTVVWLGLLVGLVGLLLIWRRRRRA